MMAKRDDNDKQFLFQEFYQTLTIKSSSKIWLIFVFSVLSGLAFPPFFTFLVTQIDCKLEVFARNENETFSLIFKHRAQRYFLSFTIEFNTIRKQPTTKMVLMFTSDAHLLHLIALHL